MTRSYSDKATIGTILKGNGYAHRGSARPQYAAVPVQRGGPFRPMAVRMGFDYFYGFMGGETDQWTPYLFRDHTQISRGLGSPVITSSPTWRTKRSRM